jgi:hypothetical protein
VEQRHPNLKVIIDHLDRPSGTTPLPERLFLQSLDDFPSELHR